MKSDTIQMESAGLREGTYWTTAKCFRDRHEYAFGDYFPNLDGKLVLDVGCSTGQDVASYATYNRNSRIVAIDVSLDRIKGAKYHTKNLRNVSVLAGDGYSAPFADRTFDYVFCLNNLWWAADRIQEENLYLLKQPLNNISNLTKRSGKLLISGNYTGLIFGLSTGIPELESIVDNGKQVTERELSGETREHVRILVNLFS